MTLRRSLRNLALAGALIVLLAGLRGGAAAAAQPEEPPYAAPVKTLEEALKTGRIRRETLDAIRRDDSAPVLVRLRLTTPFRAEGDLTGAQVEQQRQAITAAQTAILNKLGGRGFSDVVRFRTIPTLAITVDEPTLTALVALSEVLRVGADRFLDPDLAISTTVIGSAAVRNALGNPGAGWNIAVLDSGVDKNHPFLAGKVVSEACYSPNLCPSGSSSTAAGSAAPCTIDRCEHGTLVAGVAAGKRSAGGTFDGVASEAGIVAVQVFRRLTGDDCADAGRPSPCIRGRASDTLQGMERVYDLRTAFPIAAVNLSLSDGFRYTSRADCDDANQDFRDVIVNLRGAKIATVAGAGNSALDGAGQFRPGIAAPACISEAIAVGATTNTDAVAGFSQTGTLLTLLAPGVNLVSSLPGGAFTNGSAGSFNAPRSGTSYATPHVAGAFAVLRSLEPGRAVAEIRDTLIATGKPITDTRPSPAVTTARIQLDAAVEARQKRPLRPSNLQVGLRLGTSIALDWTDNSRGEAEFRVTATPNGNPLLAPGRATVNAGVTSATVAGLHPATTYTLTVRACDAAGRCSPESEPATATTVDTLPCTPRNLRAGTVTMTSIAVQWDLCPSNNPLTEFRVRTDATATGGPVTRTYGPSVHGDTFGGLSAGTRYSFWVRACNADGCSAESSMLSVLTPAPPPPAAPSNLHLCGGMELCQAGHVTLIWDDNATNEDRFEFEWSRAQAGTPPNDGAWSRVMLAANDEGHALPSSSFVGGALYFFRVRACNAGGCSTYSNRVDYTAP
jgi:subtilisin family serine protease